MEVQQKHCSTSFEALSWTKPALRIANLCHCITAQPDSERNVPSMWNLVVSIQQSMTSYKKELDRVICYPWKFPFWASDLTLAGVIENHDLSLTCQTASNQRNLTQAPLVLRCSPPQTHTWNGIQWSPGSLLWQTGILNFRENQRTRFSATQRCF